LGENVAGGDVTRVLVNVGDTIAVDQPVVELETDKATVEVPSSVAGRVREIRVRKGETVTVGTVILTVEDEAPGTGRRAPAAGTMPAPEPAAQSVPAAARPPEAKVVPMPPRPAVADPVPPPATRVPVIEQGRAAPASPMVRRLAREIGVDIDAVQGTGPRGRITQADVKEQARRVLASVGSSSAAAAGAGPRGGRALPDFERWGEVERRPWSAIRRATAERLTHAWTQIPHVTQHARADITGLEELRQKYRDQVASAGGTLTITAMLVHVLARAVRQFPQFNASLDAARGEIVYKKYVHVGVAVDTPHGLLVPVIRGADQKNLTRLAVELQEIAARARDRALTLDDMSGGSITISNLGGLGGTGFTPIVNWPEVAILGVSRAATEPVWRGGVVEGRLMLPLSLSYDHRVIDGADAMRFLQWVVEALEEPFTLSVIG
jgi:pyruvate dehydrogenase E2 component (dihydrolipoamide acetyltransferase)